MSIMGRGRGLLLAAAFLLTALAPAMAQIGPPAPQERPPGRNPAHEQAVQAREPPAPAIDPRIAAPALEAMAATIKLRDAQLVVMAERVRQLETELKDAQAQLAASPSPPKSAE